MYGYQVMLQNPNRRQQTVLRLVSAKHYSSVISLLQGESLWDQYRDLTMLTIKNEFAATPKAAPRLVDHQVARPGTAIEVVA